MSKWQITKSRILMIVLVIGSMFLYVPANRLTSGGITLHLPIDDSIPLVAVFVVPYLFALLFWTVTTAYINLTQTRDKLSQFNLQMITASVVSVVIYVVFPTYTDRATIAGQGIFSTILKFVYANDKEYSAAPSGHTFFSLLCALTLIEMFPKFKWLWIIIASTIIASTLFTKQHNLLDLILGIIFAFIIHYLVKTYSYLLTSTSLWKALKRTLGN